MPAGSADQVRILGGPYRGVLGRVEELDADRRKVRVAVPIFGRVTRLELDVFEVERV